MRVVWIVLLLSIATASAAQSLHEYAAQCAARIGQVPAFNCLDGAIVPITVNGMTPAEYVQGMTCDRPSMLDYGPESFGQCTPYSRIRDLSRGDVQISAFCRRKQLRAPADARFDEVDVILHSVRSGATCWFHAETDSTNGLDASRVPPPNEQHAPPGYVSASAFWWQPARTAGMNCGSCHDSDPFMYSPWIGQRWQHVPVDPLGWYANDIGRAFQSWPVPFAVSTRGNNCTSCHRIGSQRTCAAGIFESSGTPAPGGNRRAHRFPLSHWMPIDNPLSAAHWDVAFAPAVEALARCCKTPGLPECVITPITGRPH